MEPHAELVREIVRGERLWSDLRLIGVEIEATERELRISYPGTAMSLPDMVDLAHGFAAYSARPTDLQQWALVLLCGSAFLDLSGLESTAAGEALLEGLWDAADSGEIALATQRVVDRLTGLS